MTSQEFEQMLSHNPDKYEGVCIRDLIYEYYFKKFNSYGDANQMTKRILMSYTRFLLLEQLDFNF